MKALLAIAAVIVLAVVGYYFLPLQKEAAPSTPPPSLTSERIETRIGQEASALDVKIKPLEVLEDSRCPLDVQCVWAGTVRVQTILGSGLGEGDQVFELGQEITTEAEIIKLVEVLPAPPAGQEIGEDDYRFFFEISKRSAQ